ncbi:MAG: hypothetical protein ACOC85_03065 [Thermoplasmatota archaeon]
MDIEDTHIDSDRCHFCRSWTREYKREGDRIICRECLRRLAVLVKDEIESMES